VIDPSDAISTDMRSRANHRGDTLVMLSQAPSSKAGNTSNAVIDYNDVISTNFEVRTIIILGFRIYTTIFYWPRP